MKKHYWFLTACGGAAMLMLAASVAGPLAAHPLPSGPLHPVPPVVAPSNCATGFSQTSVYGQPGGPQFNFSCQYQITCPPGTEYLKSIQVSDVQTGSTAATFTYSCSYLSVSTQRK
jgi:hypothetical protein